MSSQPIELELPVIPSERPGPAGGVRDANRREKAQLIAQTALELFVSRGIERVSIDEICAVAGIAKGSFYRYFPDKTSLVEAMIAPLRTRILQAAARCQAALSQTTDPLEAAGAYAALAEELTPAIQSAGGVVRLYLQESRGADGGASQPLRDLAQRIEEVAIGLSDTAAQQGLVQGIPSGVAARVVIGATENLAYAWIQGRLEVDAQSAALATIRIILQGVWHRD